MTTHSSQSCKTRSFQQHHFVQKPLSHRISKFVEHSYLPRRVRTTDLTSPECPSSTLRQLPLTMSQTTANSSPEAVMALFPWLSIVPSVSHPPCPAIYHSSFATHGQLLHILNCFMCSRSQQSPDPRTGVVFKRGFGLQGVAMACGPINSSIAALL